MKCWKCGKEINVSEVFRTSECPLCSADLHCCKGCEFYSTGSHNDCRESSAEYVSDKEKANFCDYFRSNKNGSGINDQKEKNDAAKNAFNALFGGGICL